MLWAPLSVTLQMLHVALSRHGGQMRWVYADEAAVNADIAEIQKMLL